MINAQKDTLDQIKKEIPYFDFYRPDLFEIKKWEVKETDYGCVIASFVTPTIQRAAAEVMDDLHVFPVVWVA